MKEDVKRKISPSSLRGSGEVVGCIQPRLSPEEVLVLAAFWRATYCSGETNPVGGSHSNSERNHQGLANRLIRPEAGHLGNTGAIQRRQRLGGMLNYYYRTTA
jgi:hypothetical protein